MQTSTCVCECVCECMTQKRLQKAEGRRAKEDEPAEHDRGLEEGSRSTAERAAASRRPDDEREEGGGDGEAAGSAESASWNRQAATGEGEQSGKPGRLESGGGRPSEERGGKHRSESAGRWRARG